MIEPGQLMPGLVFTDPVRSHEEHPGPRKVAKHARTFKMAIGPGLGTAWAVTGGGLLVAASMLILLAAFPGFARYQAGRRP